MRPFTLQPLHPRFGQGDSRGGRSLREWYTRRGVRRSSAGRLRRPAQLCTGWKASVGAAARLSLDKTQCGRLECERVHFRGRRAPSTGPSTGGGGRCSGWCPRCPEGGGYGGHLILDDRADAAKVRTRTLVQTTPNSTPYSRERTRARRRTGRGGCSTLQDTPDGDIACIPPR